MGWFTFFRENYVAQQFTAVSNANFYYWKTETGIAEVDFVIQKDDIVYPMEVKAGEFSLPHNA